MATQQSVSTLKHIVIRNCDGVTVVRVLLARLIDSALLVEWESEVRDVLNAMPEKHIVLDLSFVDCISSYGLARLIELNRLVCRNSGSIELRGLTPRVRAILATTRLDRVFSITG